MVGAGGMGPERRASTDLKLTRSLWIAVFRAPGRADGVHRRAFPALADPRPKAAEEVVEGTDHARRRRRPRDISLCRLRGGHLDRDGYTLAQGLSEVDLNRHQLLCAHPWRDMTSAGSPTPPRRSNRHSSSERSSTTRRGSSGHSATSSSTTLRSAETGGPEESGRDRGSTRRDGRWARRQTSMTPGHISSRSILVMHISHTPGGACPNKCISSRPARTCPERRAAPAAASLCGPARI